MKNHYNPLIRKIVHLILELKFDQIQYKGNPIKDMTSFSILKRFSLAPIKQTQSQQNKGVKRLNNITYENYKSLLMEDEKAIEIYFEEKVKTQQHPKKKRQKKSPEELEEEEEEDIDKYADELFEQEMLKNQMEDEDVMESGDIESSEDEEHEDWDDMDQEPNEEEEEEV